MKLKSEWIKTFKSDLSESEVGGKFYKQAIMANAGLPIPPFFCLTTEVFSNALKSVSSQISLELKNINWSSDHSIHKAHESIHALISKVEFPADFKAEIFKNFDNLFKKDGFVSVRSSMVAKQSEYSEDSKHHAFAGMSESFLYVSRENILERIKDCFASGYSPQVLTYRHSQNIDLVEFSVSVGIQQMIFGEKSFVMFTCDPNTLERKTLVVAGHGIGEGVVQEKVDTDHFFISKKNKQITNKVVKKEKMLTFNSHIGEGLMETDVPYHLKGTPVLNEKELLELHDLGQKIEKIFSGPQDIEGCYDGHNLFILQSRPIQFLEENIIVWTSANVSESFPGTTTPLTFSFAQDFYRIIFIDCYRALGVPEKVIFQNIEHLDHMVGFLRGKIYYNLTSFYRLHSLSPLFPFFKKQWEDMMGFSGSFYIDSDTGSFKKFIKGMNSFFYTAYGLGLISWRYLTNQRDVNRFIVWWEETIKDLRGKDFSEQSAFESMRLYRKIWEEVGTNWWITLLNDTHLPTAYHVTEFLMKKWGLSEAPGLMSNLLCGGDDFKSVEIMYNGIRLSELVKKDNHLKNIFLQHSPSEVLETIKTDKSFIDFLKNFEDHLHYFGDRGLQELKMEQQSLRDNPEQLIQVIKNYLTQDLTVEKVITEEKKRRKEAETQLSKLLRFSPLKKLILRFQLWRLRGFIQNREDTRYCRSELFGFSKRIFSGIAHQFVKTGVLEKSEDIFFLHVDEVFGVIEGANITDDLKTLIKTRRTQYLEHEKEELPMDITTNGPVYLNVLKKNASHDDPSSLQGLGSSPGIVKGRARVILDPKGVDKMEEGDILIAKETDPGWLFLMLASKGMVVERGSMLSHTAITGRKFGIPTIVSVPGITERIKTGDWIEIDGGQGTVKLLEHV